MSIKNILQSWLGVSSAGAICDRCGDVGASTVYSAYTCEASDSSSGKAFSSTIDRLLCHKCGVVQKYQDASNLEFKKNEQKERQIRRDQDYIKSQKYFNKDQDFKNE